MPTPGQYTLQQLKDLIDTEITNKTLPGSILPTADGALRKTIAEDLFLKIQAASQGGGGGTSTQSFPKDNTITEAEIGLLAMQKFNFLNYPPQSVDDIECVASLCDTVPQEAGQKGVYSLSFHNIKLTKPETKIIRIVFNQLPLNGHAIIFQPSNSAIGSNVLTFKLLENLVSGTDDIEIGATIEDTINNVVAHFAANSTQLSQYRAKVDAYSTTEKYIDFEMLHGENDDIKYKVDSSIIANTDSFDGALLRSNDNFIDKYGNIIAITYDLTDNGDGYYPVTNIGDATNSLSSNIFVRISDKALYTDTDGDGLINYTEITNFLRTDFDGQLILMIAGNTPRGEYTYAFPGYYTVESAITLTDPAIRQIDIDAATLAETIYNSSNIFGGAYLLSASSWDSGNSSSIVLELRDIFRNDAGQPYGVFGAFGLRYFVDDSDAIAGLNWALSQNTNFGTMFDISSPLVTTYDNVYVLELQNKTVPEGNGYTYFNTNSFGSVYCNTSTISSATAGKPERVAYVVLGKIVGVNGDNVLIDRSDILELTMCSEEDGVINASPYAEFLGEQYFIPTVFAWRKGKVIDFFGFITLMSNSGFNGDNVVLSPLLTNSGFTPLSIGLPNGKIIVSNKYSPSFGMN